MKYENRDLDLAVAVEVFKSNVKELHQKAGWCIDYEAVKPECNRPILAMDMVDGYELKRYSDDHNYAFEVVAEISKWTEAPKFELRTFIDGPGAIATFDLRGTASVMVTALGNSVPEAICKAAVETAKRLMALRIEAKNSDE